MQPLIVFSELGKRWYVVTRYTNRGEGKILAHKKYDVTEQMDKILLKYAPKWERQESCPECDGDGCNYCQGETGKDSQ